MCGRWSARSGCWPISASWLGLLNVDGYFDQLLAFADHAVDKGFIAPEYRRLMISAGDPELLLKSLAIAEVPPAVRGVVKP